MYYREVEIRVWKTGPWWFALAPGQDREDHGHPKLRQALQRAEAFIDSVARSVEDLPTTNKQHVWVKSPLLAASRIEGKRPEIHAARAAFVFPDGSRR
jgi:hypothetical protein